MSCDSPFEYDVIATPWIEYEYVFQMSGTCKIPALSIPSFSVYEAVLPGWDCAWSWNCTKKKVCGWPKKWCWSSKTCALKDSCVWEKGGWCCPWTVSSIPVFPSFNLPMTANIPFVVAAGVDYIYDDLGLQAVQVAEFTIYQEHEINGVNQTFQLSFNFGDGIIFDFYLPPGFECTVTEADGDFSLTIPLYNFGTFASYPADNGFKYTLTMSINLLFCLGEENESWLMLQVISETEITGNGIPTYTLPINFSIPLATAG